MGRNHKKLTEKSQQFLEVCKKAHFLALLTIRTPGNY